MKIITIDNEGWEAEGTPGGLMGSGLVGANGELPKPYKYRIEFTRLDSNGKPDPVHKLSGWGVTPWDKITDSELKQILIDAKESKAEK